MHRFRLFLTAMVAASVTVPTAVMARVAYRHHTQTVPGHADFLAVDGNTVWAVNAGRVEQWTRDGMIAEVPIAHPCGSMAVADGSLWVADCSNGTLDRIDLKTARKLAIIHTGIANPKGETDVVAGAGSIWVASNAKGEISRVDPKTNMVSAKVKVAPDTFYLTFGYGSLWAASRPNNLLQKIDPRTNSVVTKTAVHKEPGFMAAGEGAVWVQEQGAGSVARINPRSGKVTGRVQVGKTLIWGDIDTGGGKVWLRTTANQIFVVIDPRTMKILARVGKASGSGALRYTPAGIWTTQHDLHTLTWWPDPRKIGRLPASSRNRK